MSTKKYYALKLVPCRPDFAFTMSEEERATMGTHVEYWKEHMKRGAVTVFGPVMDPAGAMGSGCSGSRERGGVAGPHEE